MSSRPILKDDSALYNQIILKKNERIIYFQSLVLSLEQTIKEREIDEESNFLKATSFTVNFRIAFRIPMIILELLKIATIPLFNHSIGMYIYIHVCNQECKVLFLLRYTSIHIYEKHFKSIAIGVIKSESKILVLLYSQI